MFIWNKIFMNTKKEIKLKLKFALFFKYYILNIFIIHIYYVDFYIILYKHLQCFYNNTINVINIINKPQWIFVFSSPESIFLKISQYIKLYFLIFNLNFNLDQFKLKFKFLEII